MVSTSSKSIEVVLPNLIKIATEGDVAYRIANYLIKNGWTGEDFWRESKKLSLLNSAFVNNVQNNISDISKGYASMSSVYGDLGIDMKQQLKQLKKK